MNDLQLLSPIKAGIKLYENQVKTSTALGKLVTVLVLCLILSSCSPKYTFYTAHGTGVITNGISDITEEEVYKALEAFAINLPDIIPQVTEKQIRDILRHTVIKWEPKPFKCLLIKKDKDSGKWVLVEGFCNGTQQGYYLRVKWTGHIHDCVLFHELVHEVMEFVFDVIDYKHEWKMWWDTVQILNRRYAK